MPRHPHLHDARLCAWVRRKLLSWFDKHARDLPWRRRHDAYAIWVSEVMLQQTQVATVVDYFERFLAAFPTVAALAAADLQQILRLWEGLGYYRRARALHQAARRLCAAHGGCIPNDPEALARLPGLGRYTVNAVLSQAYERRLPILEANSRRVLCRFLGERGPPGEAAVQQRLWSAAAALLPARRIGAFNQALMELGALVCTPTDPACDCCPLVGRCHAHRRGLQGKIPKKPPPPRIEEVREVAVAVWRRRKVLLVQLPEGGRWAGMWELPRCVVPAGAAAKSLAAGMLQDLGLRAELGNEVVRLRHSVTRFRITLVCLKANWSRGEFQPGLYPVGRWVAPAQLGAFPLSRPQRRLAQHLVDLAVLRTRSLL